MSEVDMSAIAPSESQPSGDVRSRRLSALAEINLVGRASATEVLDQVTQLATELMPATLGASAVLTDDAGEFDVVATTVPGQELGGASVRSEGGVTRHIFDSMQSVVVSDIDADSVDKGALAERFGVKAYVGVPIAVDGRCLGVLYVLDHEPRRYAEDDLAFLNLLAGRAAAAVHHAGVFAEMRSARERSEALAWVANAVIAAANLDEVLESVVEGVTAAVAADETQIITVDREVTRVLGEARSGGGGSDEETPLDGKVGEAIRHGRLMLAPDGATPQVMAPLRAGNAVLGAMVVRRAGPEGSFDEAEIDLIVAMANQVAIAIDNVRLLDTTRAALRETEAMYAMSQALVAGDDLPEMLDAVAEGAMAALPATGARVVMADGHDVTAQAIGGVVPEADWEQLRNGDVGVVLRTSHPVQTARRLVVPLAVHGRLLGALETVNDDGHADFTEHQLSTLQAAAAQAAVAIENHLLFGEVQRLAITDELTGVHTRRHLFELGQREFAQSVRFRKPLSAIMFDLDHFKEINDTLGHLVGDEVLAGVAGRCRGVLREIDVLGRYGGEEFAIILPDASAASALTVAERVRKAIANDPVETARGPVAVTVSLGVAEVGPGVLDLKSLLDKADAAMYAAKEAGRDQVRAA